MKTLSAITLLAGLTGLFACVYLLTGCENNSDVEGDNGEPGSESMRISPTSVDLSTNGTYAVFTVVAGVPPFWWSVSDETLGTLSGTGAGASSTTNGTTNVTASTTTQTVTYTRKPDKGGVNTIRVQDHRGWSATAVVIQDV